MKKEKRGREEIGVGEEKEGRRKRVKRGREGWGVEKEEEYLEVKIVNEYSIIIMKVGSMVPRTLVVY